MSKGDGNSEGTLEVQFVEYNKQYELELKEFDALNVKYDTIDQKHLFEQVLICKLYGLLYTLDTSGTTPTLQITNYKKLIYKIDYGCGNETNGDFNKCIFGIVSGFKAYKEKEDYSETAASDKPAINVADPYMFIFAHKSESGSGNDIIPQSNILRVHKIIKVPNSHVVEPIQTTWTKGDAQEFTTNTRVGYMGCGLFAGQTANDTSYCIVGIKNDNVQSNTEWHFYLPTHSYCLEGKTENILNLGDNYAGKFKISIPEEPAAPDAGE